MYEGHLVSRKINEGIFPTGPLLATTLSNSFTFYLHIAKGSPVSMNKRTYFDKEFLASKTGKKEPDVRSSERLSFSDFPENCCIFSQASELVGVWEN